MEGEPRDFCSFGVISCPHVSLLKWSSRPQGDSGHSHGLRSRHSQLAACYAGCLVAYNLWQPLSLAIKSFEVTLTSLRGLPSLASSTCHGLAPIPDPPLQSQGEGARRASHTLTVATPAGGLQGALPRRYLTKSIPQASLAQHWVSPFH